MNDAPSKEVVDDEMVALALRSGSIMNKGFTRIAMRAALEAVAPLFAERYAEIAEAEGSRGWHSGAACIRIAAAIRATKGTPHA